MYILYIYIVAKIFIYYFFEWEGGADLRGSKLA